MPREYRHYLIDILEAIRSIDDYAQDMSFKQFSEDRKTVDAVIRNLEVIGEAAKKVPEAIREGYPQIEWKKIAGLRDILIHEYFSIDLEIVWDIIHTN
jgi:uncharacterized protein with HEPN domain